MNDMIFISFMIAINVAFITAFINGCYLQSKIRNNKWYE